MQIDIDQVTNKVIMLDGTWYHTRPLKVICKKIIEIQLLKKQFHETHWYPWFKEVTTLKFFWGRQRPSHNKEAKIIFEVDKESYSWNHANTLKNQARIAPDNDLPLMATDPVWKDAIDIIEQRLKGSLPGIPERQDLINRYFSMSARDDRFYKALNIYRFFLYKYLTEKYSDQIYDKWRQHKLLILTVEDQTFYVQIKANLELIDCDEIIYTDSQERIDL